MRIWQAAVAMVLPAVSVPSTLGVAATAGRIGQALAQKCRAAFNMEIIYFDEFHVQSAVVGARKVSAPAPRRPEVEQEDSQLSPGEFRRAAGAVRFCVRQRRIGRFDIPHVSRTRALHVATADAVVLLQPQESPLRDLRPCPQSHTTLPLLGFGQRGSLSTRAFVVRF